MSKISETTKGIIFLISSAFCFAVMAVFVRLSGNIHFVQKAFFRNFIAFFIALFFVLRQARIKTQVEFNNPNNSFIKNYKIALKSIFTIPLVAWLFLFLRSATGSVGIFGNFYAIDRIVISDAAILNKMAPFFAILFSFVLLKEKIKPIPLIAIIVAFLGAMLIVKPTFNFTKVLPTLAGFLGGMGAGFAYACVRKLHQLNCEPNLIVLFFSTFSMILSVPYMITSFNPMSLRQFLLLCGAGIFAAGGQFTITAAYYHASAKDISIYDYSQIIFSTLLGFFFFDQVPDKYSIIGYVIIIAMAMLNFFYNKNLNK